MQPLYFLPGLTKEQLAPGERLDRAVLRARGLADVLADCDYRDVLLNEPSGVGPGDKSGLYLAYLVPGTGAIPDRTGYYPAEQDWHPVGDGSLLWMGVNKASPPTAADLVRKRPVTGYYLPMSDSGAEWLIPVIRRPDGTTEMPCDMIFDAAGNLIEPVKRAYVDYWDATADVADWFFGEQGFDSESFSKSKALKLAIRALGINYRYGINEQNVIRVVGTSDWAAILGLTIDMPLTRSLTEKKSAAIAAEQPNTLPGPPADSPTIDPAAATCS